MPMLVPPRSAEYDYSLLIAKYKIGYLNAKLQLTCQLVSVFYHSFCENNLGLIIIFSL